MNAQALDRTYEWYTSGPRQRLQPGGTIVIVMTRWNEKDLAGRLIKSQKEPKADQWEVIEFPAILPSGKPLWPEYWNIKDLESVTCINSTYRNGMHSTCRIQPLEHVIQSYDTAFMKKETADYSAITTWGVFTPNEDSGKALLLLDAIKGRYEFPELRRIAMEQYGYWNPETVIIESKASGLPLTYELRKMGIPVLNFTPSKGNDKHTRVNSVSPLFESGRIWAPTDMEFAQEVIEECAAFPYGDHDDLVDSMTQAVMRFRQGGLINHPEDYKDEPLMKRLEGGIETLKQMKQPGMDLTTGLTRTSVRKILDRAGIQVPDKVDPIEVFEKNFGGDALMDVKDVAEEMIELERMGKSTKSMDEILEQSGMFDIKRNPDAPKGLSDEEIERIKKEVDQEKQIKDFDPTDREPNSMGGINRTNFATGTKLIMAIINTVKKLKPIDAMKEVNKVVGKQGKYKNLSDDEVKKIFDETNDHIFERDVPADEFAVNFDDILNDV
jgi:predicted phage terminase large subunit-like protein